MYMVSERSLVSGFQQVTVFFWQLNELFREEG